MIAVSLDGKIVNVCVSIPISTPTFSGIAYFFRARETPPPKSEGAHTPMSETDFYLPALFTVIFLSKIRNSVSFESYALTELDLVEKSSTYKN